MKNTVVSELSLAYRPVEELKENPHNARTHTMHQIRQIAKSIKNFGFTNPILVDEDDNVVAGHGRLRGAKLLGMSRVPTVRLKNLSADQIRAYVLADNALAEKAGWDKSILAIELQHLLKIEGDFDVTLTGLEIPEIDLILQEAADKPDPHDVFEVADRTQVTSTLGSHWQLGRHRILCGSSLEKESYLKLLGIKRAGVVFVDPPYNVAIDGHASGNGSIRHREFPMASGEMSESEFVTFLTTSFTLLAQFSKSGSVHFVCMDWRHMEELLSAGKQAYESVLNVCVWIKNNAGLGSLYRSRHELIFVFRNGKAKHRNNIQLGRFGRNRTNVWEYPSISTQSKNGDEGHLLSMHPTVKPTRMIVDALLDCSAHGDLVLDSFLGSGSTLIAAERTGRCCYGIELDPVYVDTAIRRWQQHTGDHAIDLVSGKRFDEVSNQNLEATNRG